MSAPLAQKASPPREAGELDNPNLPFFCYTMIFSIHSKNATDSPASIEKEE